MSNAITIKNKDEYIPFIFYSYLLGLILSIASALTIEKYSIWSLDYPSKYLLDIGKVGFSSYYDFSSLNCTKFPCLRKSFRFILRTFLGLLLAPIVSFDLLFGYALNMRNYYANRFDSTTINIIKSNISLFYRDVHGASSAVTFSNPTDSNWINPPEFNFFRFIDDFVLENSDKHTEKMRNYIALYGLFRTLALISVLLFWATLMHLFISDVNQIVLLIFLAVLLFLAFFEYIGFVKFYRRYSNEVLMALVAILNARTQRANNEAI
ncbi:MAG: hypothetical protein HZB29_09005 [Nitrospinae bacterium]|nr:hypothetical protein [Nitrospinota bacterium]